MLFTHPAEAVGRKGRLNPEILRAALVEAGLLRPRGYPPRRHPRALPLAAPVLEMDDLGRAVAAARVSGEISERDDCDTCLASWLCTDFSRLTRAKKGA